VLLHRVCSAHILYSHSLFRAAALT
jgi:hypothetical protein